MTQLSIRFSWALSMRAIATAGLIAIPMMAASVAQADSHQKRRIGPPPKVYKEFPVVCAKCHKPDGRGGPAYGGFAADLRATALDKAGLIKVIAEGVRLRGMPEFRTVLTKREIEGIATFIEDKLKGKYYDAEGNQITAEEAEKLDPRKN
ncbi:MAG: cytochrome c [Pseudomonadota bacterium]